MFQDILLYLLNALSGVCANAWCLWCAGVGRAQCKYLALLRYSLNGLSRGSKMIMQQGTVVLPNNMMSIF